MTNTPKPNLTTPGQGALQHNRTPIPVQDKVQKQLWWTSPQWAVTNYGLEARDGSFDCKAAELTKAMDKHMWTLNMALKDWAGLDDFMLAWLVGMTLHGQGRRLTASRMRRMFSHVPRRRILI